MLKFTILVNLSDVWMGESSESYCIMCSLGLMSTNEDLMFALKAWQWELDTEMMSQIILVSPLPSLAYNILKAILYRNIVWLLLVIE